MLKAPSLRNRRYELVPQMRDYDRLPYDWVPYLMFTNRRRFASSSCRTDEHGFRITYRKGRGLDTAAWEGLPGPRGLVVGGSLAFGIGAGSDEKTVPSLLNEDSPIAWFNFGCRAFNSTQEVLLYAMHLPDVQKVVLLTGLNNLLAHPFSARFIPRLGGFVQDARFHRQMALDPGFGSVTRAWWEAVRKRTLGPAANGAPANAGDARNGERYEEGIRILARDLELWKILSRSKGFSLLFCLQPFALWMDKRLSPEEAEIFEILDRLGGGSVKTMMSHFKEMYPRYRTDLESLCTSKGIDFMDANESFPREGWLFCDRAHLTDRGNAALADLLRRKLAS